MIELKKGINRNPNKVVHIVEKILNFDKQQKGKGLSLNLAWIARVAKVSDHSNLKILTPKQRFQRLSIAFAQVEADNISENLLNEIRQILWIEQKKLLKKYLII